MTATEIIRDCMAQTLHMAASTVRQADRELEMVRIAAMAVARINLIGESNGQ